MSSVLKNSLFQGITSFRSIFQIYAFWVPISAVEGPHWVPISLKIRSPLGPHEKYFGSTLNVGAVHTFSPQLYVQGTPTRSTGGRDALPPPPPPPTNESSHPGHPGTHSS